MVCKLSAPVLNSREIKSCLFNQFDKSGNIPSGEKMKKKMTRDKLCLMIKLKKKVKSKQISIQKLNKQLSNYAIARRISISLP